MTATNSADKQHLVLPSALRETRKHGTFSFPCGFYRADFRNSPIDFPFIVNHHWHDEVEIIYFEQGSYTTEVNMQTYSIQGPCFYFINSGELHAISSASVQYQEQAIVFSPEILMFADSDPVQETFLLPLSKHQLSVPTILGPQHPAFAAIQNEFFRIRSVFFSEHKLCSEQFTVQAPVSQLLIKAALLAILGILAEHQLLHLAPPDHNPRVELLKTLISHIRQNYQRPIPLSELASIAGMNEQYFCRFFKKSFGKTPVSYLNDFRIRHAAMLLRTTELPVTEVCMESGFNNLGHFMKEFKKATQLTPLQFRKQNS